MDGKIWQQTSLRFKININKELCVKFWSYPTYYECLQKIIKERKLSLEEAYRSVILSSIVDGSSTSWAEAELAWIKDRRPYYLLYPSIAEAFRTIKFSIPISEVLDHLKIKSVCIRFAVEHELSKFSYNNVVYGVRSIIVVPFYSRKNNEFKITYTFDIGETFNDFPLMGFNNILVVPGKSVEECIDLLVPDTESLNSGVELPDELIKDCLRVIIGISLLDRSNTDYFYPDVLTDDKNKFEETGDAKYVEKARRRGKFGFHIGRDLVVNPGFVGPHSQRYHIGEGRKKIIWRFKKGYFIKREKVIKVPTGFQKEI